MSNIPSAKQSPRLERGVLSWYQGDTFDLTIALDLTDQDGEPVPAAGSVEIVFRDGCHDIVKKFVLEATDNMVTLNFDAETTALFPIGEYTYDAYYLHDNKRTTIMNDNKAVVE